MKISGKWWLVFFYITAIFVITPYLPSLIQFASSQWSYEGSQRFVLTVEIIIALLILAMGIILLAYRKKRSALFFLLSIAGIFLMSFVLYFFLPNPYEFTHLPEYAILSLLIMRGLNKNRGHDPYSEEATAQRSQSRKKEENIKSGITKNYYFLSGALTGIIGTGDEIYQHFLPSRFFNWYDILLNILGGILGLLIFWGMKK